MKKLLLVDFQKDLKHPIRKSVTGTFGSKTEIKGIMGHLYTQKKNSGQIVPPFILLTQLPSSVKEDGKWNIVTNFQYPQKTLISFYLRVQCQEAVMKLRP